MVQAKEIMDGVAALMNDAALTDYTYSAQMPYLNIAIAELNEVMQLNNVAFTNAVEQDITVPAGITSIGGGVESAGTAPNLPAGLIEIRALYERTDGSSEDFILMSRKEFLPTSETQTQALVFWAWIAQVIRFIGATSDREVKIQFIKNRLSRVQSEGAMIPVINAETFLTYRTAALCSRFIDENNERADAQDTMAQMGIDRFLGVNVKGKQAIPIRHRPFRASFKSAGNMY